MFLRADRVSLEFAMASKQGGHAAVQPQDHPLGGSIQIRRGKTWVRALHDVSLDLGSGDRLALVGHNGSGKSSLLRVLAGIYHPCSGTVAASGTVSGIFNMSLGLRLEASGYRNLLLKGLMAGRSRAEIESMLPSIAEFTGLGPYLDMPLHSYSQGMAMRLAFAATTALSDDILVMDEWIGAGDASFQEKIVERMNDVMHRSRILVVASHSSQLLRRIANRALWLEHGRVRMAGDIDEVLDSYDGSTGKTAYSGKVADALKQRHGLWWVGGGDVVDTPHLFWNIDRRSAGGHLQLYVRRPDGGRRVVRGNLRGTGIWELAPWAQPGTVFELAPSETEAASADCRIPPPPGVVAAASP